MLNRTFLPLLRVQWLAYLLASAVALVGDMAAFLALLRAGVTPALAGAAGYSFGIAVHWVLSSRLVFALRTAPGGAARMRQKAEFVGSALIGLVLTTAIVGLGDQVGIDPRLAKGLAIAVSFTTTWLLRSRIVFR